MYSDFNNLNFNLWAISLPVMPKYCLWLEILYIIMVPFLCCECMSGRHYHDQLSWVHLSVSTLLSCRCGFCYIDMVCQSISKQCCWLLRRKARSGFVKCWIISMVTLTTVLPAQQALMWELSRLFVFVEICLEQSFFKAILIQSSLLLPSVVLVKQWMICLD